MHSDANVRLWERQNKGHSWANCHRNVAKWPWIDRWKSLGWRVLPVLSKQCLPKLRRTEWLTATTVNSESLSDFNLVRFPHTTIMDVLHHGVWTFSSVRKPHQRESMGVAKLDCMFENAIRWSSPQNAPVAVQHCHIGSLSALYGPSLYQRLQACL